MSTVRLSSLRAALSAAATAIALVACGGGGAISAISTLIAGVGSGGTGIGIITGFGSLIVDGVRRTDSGASYRSESGQATALSIPLTSASLGQSAEYSYDASGNITDVLISPEFAGPVTAVTGAGITVLGTTISVNSDPALGPVTALAGYASLAAVKVGDKVEAHGVLKTDGQGTQSLQATLIKQTPTTTGVRLTGIVSQYANGAFTLGRNTVSVGQASVSPAGATLANGQLVTVWANAAPANSTVAAATIRIKRAASSTLSISGAISGYVSAANFQSGNVTVDASSATVSPPGAVLANERYLVATGAFDAATNKLKATTITVFTADAPTTVELHGVIASYVSRASFVVRGADIDASSATFSGGQPSQLANGVFVEIHGTLANNAVRATSVAIQALTPTNAPSGSVIQVDGVISAYNAQAGSYTLTLNSGERLDGTLEHSAAYSNGTAANLVAGQAVSLTGVLTGTTLASEAVNFQSIPPPDAGTLKISGVAYNVTATSFMLNGLVIQINGVAIGGHGLLAAGAHVEANVRSVAGQYLASAIYLEDD